MIPYDSLYMISLYVVLIPEENIVLISEESNGFMSITEKLINYKENWKFRFSKNAKSLANIIIK